MKNRVRIIAPSGALETYEESVAKLQAMQKFLESNGFVVSVQEDIFSNPSLPFCANTDEKRLSGLHAAILSPDVDIIWAFRGGYGSGRIAKDCMNIHPVGDKILIGASDITALHALFNQHYRLPSIHGPVLSTLVDKMPGTIEYIKYILDGNRQHIIVTPLNGPAKLQKVAGILIGGNLTVFCTLLSTKLHPATQGKILLFEDVAEPGYKIDRMLDQLDQAGVFENVIACIFGDFTGGDAKTEHAIRNFAETHPALPIFRTDGVGHGDVNHPLVMGAAVVIADNTLECSSI